MTDSEFLDLAENLLRSVEASCDRINDQNLADIDNQRVGAMVTLVFSNGSQIVINLQKPLHEVWLAAKSGGYTSSLMAGSGATARGGASSLPVSQALPASRPLVRSVFEKIQDSFLFVGGR